jgi:hypothetical protein
VSNGKYDDLSAGGWNFFEELDKILESGGVPRARRARDGSVQVGLIVSGGSGAPKAPMPEADTPRVDTMTNAAREYERARDELARASRNLPVSVDVSETGRATLVFRMDWRLARRVLTFCRELNVFEDDAATTKADGS